jgi:carbon starvation protein
MVLIVALVLAALAVFWFSYWTYGRYVSRLIGVSDANATPAHRMKDGGDYVPTKRAVLFGHHFASIAGAGPIVGPIVAAAAFGWFPALVWILVANPLMGSVHDYVTTMGSVRQNGKSMGSVIGRYVGPRGSTFFILFALLLVILVLAVFAVLIADIFEAYPAAATASFVAILLASAFGFYLYKFNGSLVWGSVVFVPLIFASVFVGMRFPIVLDASVWLPILLTYSFLASILPVWSLLQPRDYLSSFLLVGGLGGALIGILVGGLKGADYVQLPFFTNFMGNGYGPLFPLLFVTIACGAVSGAHCLVACGTTSKQLDRESHGHSVGYGGMLMEGLVAVIAISTIAVIGVAGAAGDGLSFALPSFAAGGAVFLAHLGMEPAFGATFMALVLASFLLTTLDTVARLGRYLLQELAPTPSPTPTTRAARRVLDPAWLLRNKHAATLLVLVPAYLLTLGNSWETLWPLFGSANQLLAALAFFGLTAWLANMHAKKQLWTTGIPAALLFVVTTTGFAVLSYNALTAEAAFATARGAITAILQVAISATLVGLATLMALDTYRAVRARRALGPSVAPRTTDAGPAA